MLKENQDAYGQELLACYEGEEVFEIVEREDGYITAASSNPRVYFAPFEEWPAHQQEAMSWVQGRVLDIGCGAGRVSLYLQGKGHDVLGIDNSPLALEVSRRRGVQNLSLTSLRQVNRKLGVFDSIVMMGNNFGLFGSLNGARRLLKKFHKLTSPQARIVAESNDVYQTTDTGHLAYQEWNRQRGRMSGQLRIRIRYRKTIGRWFDYLMVSKEELQAILSGTGWRAVHFIDPPDRSQYIAVIEKE